MCLATVEFRSSMDSGVCSQEPSMKSALALPTKKSVTYPGDFQDTPAKPPLYHKQPPALPPKPFSRIPNHNTGQWSPWFSFWWLFILFFFVSKPSNNLIIVHHPGERQVKSLPVMGNLPAITVFVVVCYLFIIYLFLVFDQCVFFNSWCCYL